MSTTDVDYKPIIVSLVFILLSFCMLYYKTILELYDALKVAYAMGAGMLSNADSRRHLFRGWTSYLFGERHQYGYGSGSTAMQIGLANHCDLYNKTVIITGGNSGIGYSLCLAFAAVSQKQWQQTQQSPDDDDDGNAHKSHQHCSIIMASRNEWKSKQAIQTILARYPQADIRYIALDLGNVQSIKRFVHQLKQLPSRVQHNLCMLLNNAGVAMLLKGQSVKFDNEVDARTEKTVAVNYLGPFLLTQLVYDGWFKNSDTPCVVVNQSSIIHTVASRWTPAQLTAMQAILKYHLSPDYDHVTAYGVSKLFNILHCKMMRDEYATHGVAINACHPGSSIDTHLTAQLFASGNFIIRLSRLMLGFLWKSNDQCAATAMLLACDPRITQSEKVTGAYFQDCHSIESSRYTHNEQVIQALKTFSFDMYNKIK